jgi:hypothetical protein
VLYVAHPLAPTMEEVERVREGASWPELWTETARVRSALSANIDVALRWLAWLRRSFPETTFIAPWIAAVVSGEDDSDPKAREAGMVDDCAVVERCDGIVLCGERISSGMRREMEHGQCHRGPLGDPPSPVFEVYDLTSYQIEGASGRNEDGRTFEQWVRGYRESCTR